MSTEKIPVIVGASQYTQPKQSPAPLDPVGLMAKAAAAALIDAGSSRLRDCIDMVCVPYIGGWKYADAPGRLSNLVGLKPAKRIYSYLGGNMPQKFVNMAAHAISSGKSQAVLICGGEAQYSTRRRKKGEIQIDWPGQKEPEKIDGEKKLNSSDFENDYNLLMPVGIYAMLESVLKHISGQPWQAHTHYLGQLLKHFADVAATHPYAWSRERYEAADIITPSPENRYICYPYTKRMVANIQIDQSAALIMTSNQEAQRLGIDPNLWVYPMGGADIENIYYTIQRPELHTSPATAEGSRAALKQAGLSLRHIDLFDIYSCFPSMIQILMQEIGIQKDEKRDLTVTGGLPYFGAPLNNYSLHAIATIVERIRNNRSLKALVVAIGGMNTKPSFGIYGDQPPAQPWAERNDQTIQEEIFSKTLPEPVHQASGELIVDAFAIHYSRDGRPESGTVMGKLENGRRTLAFIKADPDELEALKDRELIGLSAKVQFCPDLNRNQAFFAS